MKIRDVRAQRFSDIMRLAGEAPSGNEILSTCLDITELLLEKNISYGSSFSKPPLLGGLTTKDALYCRMSDKLSRLTNNQSYADEGMKDAFTDLAGYIILWMVLDNADV